MTDPKIITPTPFSGPFSRVLVANRGAIACRIIRTLRRLGIGSVAVYSEADRHSLHVRNADEAVFLGPSQPADSYLHGERILEAARRTGAEAIHPGYGFLSESADFAESCARAGLAFVGPTPGQIREFGLKHRARALAHAAGVPLLPGSGLLASLDEALQVAGEIGYPVMLKSTAGGGGIGMQRVDDADTLATAWASVQRLAEHHFSAAGIFLERFVSRAHHVEVQILGDGRGGVVAIGDRDCSAQRRNQKVIEEAPAPRLPETARARLRAAAESLGAAVAYRNAGTVEFLHDAGTEESYFLEVNTRLQVEHGVTEAVTGIDLVEWMLRIAADPGIDLEPLRQVPSSGHAIQVRIYAENPGRHFQPSTGRLTEVSFPKDVRVDTWIESGIEVSPFYDPLLAKLIVHAETRPEALQKLHAALECTRTYGIETNLAYLRQRVADPVFVDGIQTTRWLGEVEYQSRTLDVLEPGMQSSVQDWPGRVGYWDIGVPPSGPMDSLAFRIGNALVGNPATAAGLEFTATGPRLRFNCPAMIAVTGAAMAATLDTVPIAPWTAVRVEAGQVLAFGPVEGGGVRTYLAVRGGIDVPETMGSRSTFALGQMGGHGGRLLATGDVLHLGEPGATPEPEPEGDPMDSCTPQDPVSPYPEEWDLRVLYGPHGAPDFFTVADLETFFASTWEVHYNSSRTGIRLLGPKPEWARADGGEAGLHPSNIHDNAYAIGTVDFTGDMPVILGPDGPSLGGFVCPVTLISADLWKLGQLRPGNRIRFIPVSHQEARELARQLEQTIAGWLSPGAPGHSRFLDGPAGVGAERQASRQDLPRPPTTTGSTRAREWIERGAVLHRIPASEAGVDIVYRPAGDRFLLIEYGPNILDLALRFRVQALLEWLQAQKLRGLEELTPGVRSLQVHYDPDQLPRDRLLERLVEAESRLQDWEQAEVPSRIVHLPLAWDDSQTQLATRKYMQSVRPDAPWCPRNLEFIRRVNGLESEDAVKRIVFDASYLVMGLGDVYLSAPLATPLDPRHRLVTTKYNPARTWTPENAVGIGGAYLCIYGMEGPGGYQFVGRTLQVWNRYHRTPAFTRPWLLRFFDQIRFHEVDEATLLEMREAFPHGGIELEIEETRFSLAAYRAFLRDNAESIEAFQRRQQAAFAAERERWGEAGSDLASSPADVETPIAELAPLRAGEEAITGPVAGSVWAIEVVEEQRVEAGQTLLVVESMKMEIPIVAPDAGRIVRLLCQEGTAVQPGTRLMLFERQPAAAPGERET